MKKIFILIGLFFSLAAFSQLDITKRNVIVTQNFHVRGDSVLNASEVRALQDFILAGFGIIIRHDSIIVDTSKVPTLKALGDSINATLATKENISDTTGNYGRVLKWQMNGKVDKTLTINNKTLNANIRLYPRRDFLVADSASNDSMGLMTGPDHLRLTKTLYGGTSSFIGEIPFWIGTFNQTAGSNAFNYDSTNHILNIKKNALGATPSGGIELTNITNSIFGAPQTSPLIFLKNYGSKTDGTAQKYYKFSIYNSSIGFATTSQNETYIGTGIDNGAISNQMSFVQGSDGSTFVRHLSNSTLYGTVTVFNGLAVPSTYLSLNNYNIATSGAKTYESVPFILYGSGWSSSVARSQRFKIKVVPVADSEKAQLLFQYSHDGGTNFKSLLGIDGTYGISTINNIWISEGLSQSSPNISITSAGKSMAIYANSTTAGMIGDNSATITRGFDSKANIDARASTPATIGDILTPAGYLYRHSVAADSMYFVRKQIDQAISFATTGLLDDKGAWNASSNTLPSSGVLIGDKYTISVAGLVDDSLFVNDIIIALVNTPSQSIANWNHIPVNAPKSLQAYVAGNTSIGAIKYNGLTQLDGAFNGTANTLGGTKILKYTGTLAGNSSSSYGIYGTSNSSAGIVGLSNSNSGVVANSTSNYAYYGTSVTGGGLYINQTSGNIANLLLLQINTTTKASIDYTGKGTFNGGVSTPVMYNTATKTTVNGSTSGTMVWTMPEQGSSSKKVIIEFNALTDAGNVITFPTAFTTLAPDIIVNSSGLIITTISTTSITIPAAIAATGRIILEGL